MRFTFDTAVIAANVARAAAAVQDAIQTRAPTGVVHSLTAKELFALFTLANRHGTSKEEVIAELYGEHGEAWRAQLVPTATYGEDA